jgi:hypothetical protein
MTEPKRPITGVGVVTDENAVDTEVDVTRSDKDVEVQTGGVAVDVEREDEESDADKGDEGA